MTRKPPAKAGREQAGRFKPGQSGNPAGRASGSRNRATLALDSLLDGQGTTLTETAINLAIAGDIAALRICLDRILPVRRDRPIAFDLPPLSTSADAAKAALAILNATASGDLTPSEAEMLSRVVHNYAETVRICELEARIADLEAKQ